MAKLELTTQQMIALDAGSEIYLEQQCEIITSVTGEQYKIVAASIGSHYGGPRKLMMTVRKKTDG